MQQPIAQRIENTETHPSLVRPDLEQHPQKIRVERLRNPPGEGSCYFEDRHSLFITLSPRPVRYVHSQDGKTLEGLFRPGDMLITPAKTLLSTRWEDDEHCLHIQLATEFLQTIARETFASDRLQLVPQIQFRSPQLEAIAGTILAEVQQNAMASQLCLDSLANVLAVNLLRHHATGKPKLPIPVYEGGLPPRQLQRVLDYIDAHLDRKIELEKLAELLDMSQFHFSRLFKQSIGSSPYQYTIGQRVERAKQLLKQTDRPITDIAMDCGFNSHSHLSKQFRQVTGMTPKAFRSS